jgi:hypothetical protein
VKYGIQYFFLVQDSMRYYLSLVFDKDGQLLSEDFLPDQKTNGNFAQLIDACSAIQIADADSVFKGESECISLEYLPGENTFAWIVEKPSVYKERGAIIERFIILNATTGKLIRRKTTKGLLVCALQSF